MKEVKKYLPAGFVVFLLYLVYLYWKPLIGFIGTILGAATPLLIGLIIAYIVNVVMIRFEALYKKIFKGKCDGARRPLCIILSFASVIAVIALVTAIVMPQVINAVTVIVKNGASSLTPYLKKLEKYPQIAQYAQSLQASLTHASSSVSKQSSDIIHGVLTGATGAFSNVVKAISSVFSVLSACLFGFIFSLYLLGSKEKLQHQLGILIKTYIPKGYDDILHVANVFNHAFSNFIVCKAIDGLSLGVMTTIGCLIFHFPYAIMVGVIIGVTALVPIIGAYVGAAISAFLIFIANPIKALYFLIFYVILQQIDDNIIYPRIVGSSLGLPAIWILGAVTVFGGVFGFVGMLIGVPITSGLYTLLKEDVIRRRQKAEVQ